ncbi:rho GTPase-activating protein gacU-like [Daphnia carinata]|uniref:rho GTPase-activating protein gacU-like n=1 Tax=Daphnia carinata TaxID=120202 RepID=UPI00257CC830|nr:rho GTPase-activating protein gacU-like [Daphnia carinata]
MKIEKPSYLTLAVLTAIILLVHPYIAETNNNLPSSGHLLENTQSESTWIDNRINAAANNTSTIKENETSHATFPNVQEKEGKTESTVVTFTDATVAGRHGRNYDYHPSPVHIDFSPIFLAIVPIALFLGAAAAFALATASSSSSSAAAAAQQQQQQQEAANNNNNANNANNNNNNAILAALIAAIVQKGSHSSKGHKTIIYAYNVTKVHDHDWRRSYGDSFKFSLPRIKPMSPLHRMRKYSKVEP